MNETLFFTGVIGFMFIVGLAYFLFSMGRKLAEAEEENLVSIEVYFLLPIAWGCLFICVFTGCGAARAYSASNDLRTHELDLRWVVMTVFAIDLLAKVTAIGCSALLYSKF